MKARRSGRVIVAAAMTAGAFVGALGLSASPASAQEWTRCSRLYATRDMAEDMIMASQSAEAIEDWYELWEMVEEEIADVGCNG